VFVAALSADLNEFVSGAALIDYRGLILATQEALNHFGPEGGSIINVSSIVSTLSPADQSVYNATKSAVDGLTRTFLRRNLASENPRQFNQSRPD
jgi:NAD(P)-dependent dehydrogenase (short-subunit alcohol dehydrogenase family)